MQSFQKLFSGGHLFVFVEYLCNRSPKIKTKNIKKYSSILAIVNHWNWLDDSPPLNTSPKLDICTFSLLVFALSLYQISGKVPTGYGFRSSILRYLCPTKIIFLRISDDVIACDFWFGLPIKNPGYAYGS